MARIFFILLIGAISYFSNTGSDLFVNVQSEWISCGISLLLSLTVFLFLDMYVLKKVAFYKILTMGITFGILLIIMGISMHLFKIQFNFALVEQNQNIVNMIGLLIIVFITYLGLNYGSSANYFKTAVTDNEDKEIYLVDTSAIIDGRVLDVCKAGFLTRDLVIPEFVVREMQLIADSSIHEKRKKGRRGLNILRKIKESDDLSINIPTTDYDNLRGVDNKLLAMAKEQGAKIISTDYNLVKVAEVEGIEVINVNKLATILKPQHQIGEKVKVNITKKGNSKRQGVGYLDDDTMVVIDDGEKFINQSRMAVVTAYIQSETGKMLFCRLI